MAHSFDTGLAAPLRTLLRNGAITLLAPLLKTAGGYLAAVVPWGGIIRGYTDEDGIALIDQVMLGRVPSVAIALGDESLAPSGGTNFTYKGALEMDAYFYARNLRSITEGRTSIDAVGAADDTADPGLDVMMDHVRELLVGARAGSVPAIKQIRPRSADELRTEDSFTLWVQRYEVTLDVQINRNRGISQLIHEFRTNVRAADGVAITLAASPTGATELANVATYTTTLPHELKIGDLVIVNGVGVAGYNGALFVATTPTATTFTAQLPIAGLGASGGGTVTIRPVAALQNLIA